VEEWKRPSGGTDMPLRDLIINDQQVPITRFINNSLTLETCTRFNLESVDIDTVHTNLSALGLKVVSPKTYGLIYYVPYKVYLDKAPISASMGVRLLDRSKPPGTIVEAVTYTAKEYKSLPYRFPLSGSLGCTAAVNLGFLLLYEQQKITTRQLEVLIVLDRARLQARMRLDLPVADDAVVQFCRERGYERIAIDTDCPYYPECQDQEGQRCDTDWAKCRPKA
jgi:hypothetical protein